MGESLSRLLTSKRSIIGLLTCVADIAVLLGMWETYDHQLVMLIAGVVTTVGTTLIAGRSISDHGESQERARLASWREQARAILAPEDKPSDVDTENGGDEVLADD